jgi:hypothetical protein
MIETDSENQGTKPGIHAMSDENSPPDSCAPDGPLLEPSEVLEAALNRAYARAKVWSGAAILLQCALFIAGIVAIFLPSIPLTYPWEALPLGLIGAWIFKGECLEIFAKKLECLPP